MRPITGRHVLWGMLAFFGAVTAVNGAFVWLAMETHPGVETPAAYSKGLAYNREIATAERQRALGWRVAVAWRPRGPAAGRLAVTLKGRDGAPLTGRRVEVRLRRPVHDREDRRVVLGEGESGTYGADLSLPGPGNWVVDVLVRRDGEADFRAMARLAVD